MLQIKKRTTTRYTVMARLARIRPSWHKRQSCRHQRRIRELRRRESRKWMWVGTAEVSF